MIPSTTTFANAVESNGRTFRAKIMHEGSEVQCNIIEIKPIKGSCDGETFAVGSVFSSSAEIVVSGLSEALENEDITLQIGVLNENDDFEYIDYAQYTVIKTKKSASMAILTAVGVISARLNVPIPDIAGTPTIQAVATAISAASGVSVSFVGITGLSNTLAKGITGMTCRGALEIITFLVGGFATENNAGGIEIHKYAIPSTPVVFPEGRSLTEPVTADDTFNMTGVKVIVGTDYTITTDTTVDSEKTYYTRSGSGTSADPYVYTEVEEPTGNPHAKGYYEVTEKSYTSGDPIRQTYQSEYMTASMFNVFASNIVGYSFMPATVDMSLGDPRLEPWDVLSVSDGEGGSWIVPCHLLQPYFDGGFSCMVTATGESETDGGVEGTITKQIGDMAGQLAVTQQSATLAKAAAQNAKKSADEAAEAANAANEILEDMEDAAEAAGTTLTQIYQDAADAADAADNAMGSAIAANIASNSALTQLSVVEDVAAVLTWISEHGTYKLTADTAVVAGKLYFTRSGDEYELVTNPTGNPHSSGYYEIDTIGDEAVSNYISSHLSLTNQGLWVVNDNSSYKILLSSTGMKVYDAQGNLVSTFGESITFSSTRAQYIGNNNAYIRFNPSNDGSIIIGGRNIILGSDKPLSEVLDEVEGTLIFDTTYEWDSGHTVATLTAHVYRGGVDIAQTEFAARDFTWYLKSEDGEVPIIPSGRQDNTGYTTMVNVTDCGYGAEVVAKFTPPEYAAALTNNGDTLTDTDGDVLEVRASGDTVRVRDLTVSTTLYPTDKVMIVGAEDEHLVTMQTLQDYLNLHLDKQVLFGTTSEWNAQGGLVSEAGKLYVYTDYKIDSEGHNLAGIKVGDGDAYLIDMPFTDELYFDHIQDSTIHVTESDKLRWDDAVNCYYSSGDILTFVHV